MEDPGDQWAADVAGRDRIRVSHANPERLALPDQQLPAKAIRIGCTSDNDVVLRYLDISRHHAELRRSAAGSYEIVDLGTHNGTFVNGKRISRVTLTDQDIVSIGHSSFRLTKGELWRFTDYQTESVITRAMARLDGERECRRVLGLSPQ